MNANSITVIGFSTQEESIPILDTTRLFATTLTLAPAERKDEAEANVSGEVAPSPTRPADFAKTQPLEVAALAPMQVNATFRSSSSPH